MNDAAGAAQKVGAFTAACLLISNAIGSGIFTTTGFMARDLGEPLLILGLWLTGGVLALGGAISYAELGAAMPRSGGEYVYLRRAYGSLPAFLSGWTSFTLGFGAAIAAAAVAFAEFLLTLIPDLLPWHGPVPIALILVWTLSVPHLLGVEQSGRVQRILTIAKIAGIAALIGAALTAGEGSWGHLTRNATEVEPSPGAILVSGIFVLYAYSGWNAAAYIAGEIRSPARSLPRALVSGTLFVTAVYVAVNLAYFWALPAEALAQEPVLPVAEKAARALFGAGAAGAVVAVLCLSIAGAASAMIWAGPRVYAAMAADGLAPAALARASSGGAPRASIALQSTWVTVLILSGTFEQLIVYSGIALAFFSALTVACVPVLRLREPELARPYRAALYPWLPAGYVAASLAVAGYGTLARPVEGLLAALTVLAGVPLYLWWSNRP